jgi:hypothetical protein
MRWKIYFWVITCILLGGLYQDALVILQKPGIFTLNFLQSALDTLALVSYIFRKQLFRNILTPLFWRYFFVVRILLAAIFILYGFFPHVQVAAYMNLFYLHPPKIDGVLIFAILLDLPTFYAVYQLSQSKVLEENLPAKKNTQKSKDKKRFKWGMVQMALWGYSSVITFVFFVLSLFPQDGSDKTSDQNYMTILIVISLIFVPILIFWAWVVIRYKKYKWNWWKTTLVANALVLSGATVFSVFDTQQNQGSSGYDFVGVLQILILLVSLYVFGKEQFSLDEDTE